MTILKLETPNGVVIDALLFKSFGHINLCYAQNRIFTVFYVDNRDMRDPETGEYGTEEYHYGEILVEYAKIPEYDEILQNEYTYDDYIDDLIDQKI